MHKYYLFVEGLPIKSKTFDSRKAAEICMHEICQSNNLQIQCIEQDKHERMYKATNKELVNFYINRF